MNPSLKIEFGKFLGMTVGATVFIIIIFLLTRFRLRFWDETKPTFNSRIKRTAMIWLAWMSFSYYGAATQHGYEEAYIMGAKAALAGMIPLGIIIGMRFLIFRLNRSYYKPNQVEPSLSNDIKGEKNE